MSTLDRYHIVLVRPEDGANIGAVCRVMKNMGLSRLTIVKGREPEKDRIRQLAVHAYDVFETAQIYRSLDEALSDSMLSAGFTRRRGRRRKYISYTPEQFISRVRSVETEEADPRKNEEQAHLSPAHISLVFGNERSGLTDNELARCDCAVGIPTSAEFPSLNLSHAVGIISYLIARVYINQTDETSTNHLHEKTRKAPSRPVTREELDKTVSSLISSLSRIGFFSITDDVELSRFIRDILARALICEREAERIEDIFRKIADMKIHKGGDCKNHHCSSQ